MKDLRYDPNFQDDDAIHAYDGRMQWAAVAVILLLCAGLIVAAAFSGGETQTAMNSPSIVQPVTSVPQKP